MEGQTGKRDFRRKKKSGKVYNFRGSEAPPAENFCSFELPRPDFLQFQHDFRSFSDKKGLLLRGPKPFSGEASIGAGLGKALG